MTGDSLSEPGSSQMSSQIQSGSMCVDGGVYNMRPTCMAGGVYNMRPTCVKFVGTAEAGTPHLSC